MGERGPKPLPTNVHLLQGNRSKLPAHKLKDSVTPEVKIPDCPTHLLPEAKKEWKRLAPQLERLGLISELDRAFFAAYCQAYGRWVQVEKQLKKHGDAGLIDTTPSGYKQMSVWLQISGRALSDMEKYGTHFGFSPSSRSRVTPLPQQDDLFADDKPTQGAGRFFNS